MTTHTIDAKNKKLGRVATQAAMVLMGKNEPTFRKNTVADVKVLITNASLISLDEVKAKNTTHMTYSGYPGGEKILSSKELVAKKGYEALFIKAIKGMLPTNKLRDVMLKNLTVTE
ncbi:MAG: uL13 family ribosomal protein [Candidatus Pacebacteria bacterium]|nr:uL13 family ribosomal protein [Candidatus Paceibacterota bacterium]